MWFPRIRIKLLNSVENQYYDYNKWYFLCHFKSKKNYYKYSKGDYIDFVIDSYNNRKSALKNGKILFFNILFYGYRGFNDYSMGDDDYVEPSTLKEDNANNNSDTLFVESDTCSSLPGFKIYKANNINELNVHKHMTINLCAILNYELEIIGLLKKMDLNCSFSEKSQKIFRVFGVLEHADVNLQVLLLCQILEYMGEDLYKSNREIAAIDKCINIIEKEDLDLSEKCSLKDSLESLKYESSRKKIKKLLELYCKKDYKNFDKNKIAMSGYKMRSYIIHGKTIDEIEGIYDIAHKLKIITLDTFKEWSKKAVTN